MRRGAGAACAKALAALLALGIVMVGCAVVSPGESELQGGSGVVRLLAQDAVLVRGWIGDDGVGLEPVTPLPAAAGNAGDTAGPYRLRGLDDHGRALFDLRFGTESLAAVPGRPGRHFVFALPVGAGGSELLATVVLDAGAGLTITWAARWSRDVLRDGLSGEHGVQQVRSPGASVTLTWDADRFALLQLRDPATGSVLALDRDGEVTVAAPGGELEIALSDGVRSAAALLRTAEAL